MKKKRVLSLCMAAVLGVASLAGCAAKPETKTETMETKKEVEKEQEAGMEENEIPTYTIATVRWTDTWPTDYLESGIMKELEEKHGINIEWQVYYNSDWTEQKSLLLASGDLPDAFFGSICLKDTDIAQNKSYFLELTDLIGANMPNLNAIFEKEPTLLARAKDRNGEIYSLVKKLPLRPTVCGEVMYINQTWLDNLSLPTPTTYEELETVLEAFITQDADGDGDPNNETGFTGNAGQIVALNNMRTILAPFDTMISREQNYMGLNKDGNPVFMPVQENYKEAVSWLNGMYQKGIIDAEFFTQEESMATAKRQAEGGSNVGLFYGWTADSIAGPNADQFVVLEALAGPTGGRFVENAQDYLDISDRELVVSKDCKNPEKLLQWADDFYTDLASLQTLYGSIPDQVKDNGDGTYDVLVPTDGTTLDTSAWSNSMRDFGPKYMAPEFYANVNLPQDQGDGIKLKEDEVNAKYVQAGKSCPFPMVKYTDEELQKLTSLGTDIYKYVEAQHANWVVNGGIEAEWDGYLKQLDSMGLQELVTIQNNAYAAYLTALE